MQLPKVLIISGPTAIGKSAAALSLHPRHAIEIVSADSVQVYRGLDVGSNKPTHAERSLVPHHMIDVADASEGERTAGDYFRAARGVIEDIVNRQKIPVVVGGTMMYVRWLVHGKPATPRASIEVKERVEEMVRGKEWEEAVEILKERDEDRAESLTRNDWYRLKRGLEVVEVAGRGVSELPIVGGAPGAEGEWDGVDVRWVFLWGGKEELYRRIDRRCEEMVLNGLVDEVGEGVEWGGVMWKAIGYRQMVKLLCKVGLGEDGLVEVRTFWEEFMSGSRRYAKQQLSWFRKEGQVGWVEAGDGVEERVRKVLEMGRDEWEICLQGEEQNEVREKMIKQGKEMKGYIARKEIFEEGGEKEQQLVEKVERVGREVLERIGKEEVERILKIVER